MSRVLTGIEVLRGADFAPLRGLRVGLLTNPSGVDAALISTVESLRRQPNVRLAALFAPEHGVFAAARAGASIASSVDARTGLPVHSLYGEQLRPTRAMLAGLDVLVCDLQDVGARFYTYLWTISHVLEALGEYGVPVLILDRPNPLGDVVAGPLLRPDCASLVGRYPIPIRHGMTLGELARLINATWNPAPADLTVIPCDGWQRSMTWEQTGLPFVPPSPNMPHLITARQYPGACLIEGTTLSEGRGTALPFEIVGAPGIDGSLLADHLNGLGWQGVGFRACRFQPTASKHAGSECYGVQVHVTDAAAFEPISVWLSVIRETRHLFPDAFGWLPPVDGLQHFDRLIGNRDLRPALDAGASLAELTRGWDNQVEQFRVQRQPFLLYP